MVGSRLLRWDSATSLFSKVPSLDYVDKNLGPDEIGNHVMPLLGALVAGLTPAKIETEWLARSLRRYVAAAWDIVEPGIPFQGGWHIDCICEHLEAVTRGELLRLIINVPPRSGKSSLVSVLWPTWTWISQPESKWLCTSYHGPLTTRDAVRSRHIIQSSWYQARWGQRFSLRGDQNEKQRYENDCGGYRVVSSVGGANTGEGGDFVICFPGETRITTNAGDLAIGQIVDQRLSVKVLTYRDSALSWQSIEAYQSRPASSFVKVTLADGRQIEATEEHPIYVEGRGYVPIKALASGDMVYSISGVRDSDGPQLQAYHIVTTAIVAVERTMRSIPVYNLRVAHHHNYFANGILAHNCDDPHNVKESESEIVRQEVIHWWTQVMSTRYTNPNTFRRVIIMQRVHQNDLTGYLLAHDNSYHHLVLPAEYEPKAISLPGEPQPHKGCPIYEDPRTKAGELLWPERIGRRQLADLKAELGPYGTAGQLQQNPTPREGALFKVNQIKALPADFDVAQPDGVTKRQRLRLLQAWDLAYSERDKADYTVAVTGGVDAEGNLYLLDRYRERIAEQRLEDEMAAVINRMEVTLVCVEEAAYRQAATRDLVWRLQRVVRQARVVPVKVSTDKYMRAQLPAGRIMAGQVFADKSAAWWPDFSHWLAQFPLGQFDDDIDAFSLLTHAAANLPPVMAARPRRWSWRADEPRRQQWDPFAQESRNG